MYIYIYIYIYVFIIIPPRFGRVADLPGPGALRPEAELADAGDLRRGGEITE